MNYKNSSHENFKPVWNSDRFSIAGKFWKFLSVHMNISSWGLWPLVNLNWSIKFLQSFISFRVENSLQVKMCSHAISHWFENFTSVNLTEVKYYPKWTQTQSEIKFHVNAGREHTTHRSELRPVWFHFGSHVNIL